MKAKTLPSKRLTAQGDDMGKRGLSLQGGMNERMVTAADGKAYLQTEFIHTVYTQGSKQSHDDAMRGMEAQIEFIAANREGDVRLRLRSDKCNNFCTFAMIACIVEGNARGWRRILPGGELSGITANVRVISWTFSEAQTGKDQLDVNFSYVSKSFKSYVSGGKDLMTGKDMFEALQIHPIKGTSAVLADVRGPVLPVYDKCPLGIQKCHSFQYMDTEVVVRHHSGIDNIGVWRCPNAKVVKWIKGGAAVRKPNKDIRPYATEPPKAINTFTNLKPIRKKGKVTPKLGGKRKRVSLSSFVSHPHLRNSFALPCVHKEEAGDATEWMKQVCVLTEKFANKEHNEDVLEAAKSYNTPEPQSVLQHHTGGKYWALKKNVPTVRFPLKLANVLRVMYNEKDPHVSPDEAAERLTALPQHAGSLYIKYVMNADKIKAFFSTLKNKKKNGEVPVLVAGTNTNSDGYGQWTTVPAMKDEFSRRLAAGTISKPVRVPSDKQGWAVLLELNDLQLSNTLMMADEECAHADGVEDGEANDDLDDMSEAGDDDEVGTSAAEAHMSYDLLGDDALRN